MRIAEQALTSVVHNYERLTLWQRGMKLAAAAHRAARSARPGGSDRALWDQITRAAVSIPANVAEGAERGTSAEFARFLAIAMGSAAELHSLLRVGSEAGILPAATADMLATEAVALRRMAAALRARARGFNPRKSSKTTR